MPKTPSTLVPFLPITLTEQQCEYAKRADSRILPPWARKVLLAAGRGEEVSAWDLHGALDQALSSVATRFGQSMVRRSHSREVRHLIYKADAVIEAHLAGLEPVDSGARSPRIAELTAHNDRLREDKATLQRQVVQALDIARAMEAQRDEANEVDPREALLTKFVDAILTDDQRAQVSRFVSAL